MKALKLSKCVLTVAFFCLSFVSHAAVATYDFSSETLVDEFNGYLGGWYGNNFAFDQWYGDFTNSSITGSASEVSSTAPDDERSSVVLLAPSEFSSQGAGDYELRFDLTGFTLSDGLSGGNDFAFASIWSGSGYDLSAATGNALFVEQGFITPQGTAVANEIARVELTSQANNLNLGFTYDGTSAIAIYLGAGEDGGYPFPTALFENVQVVAVPEPGMLKFVLPLCLGLMIMHRFTVRRRA